MAGPKTITSYSTLFDHEDYVRSVVYADESQKIFSASDDGQIKEWDLNHEMVINKYETENHSEKKNPLLWVKNRFERNYDA